MIEMDSTRFLIREYYEAWARQDREAVRRLIADDLSFVSPQDAFDSAESFLTNCWRFSKGLCGVRFIKEVYDEHHGFLVLEWAMEDGSRFADAEFVRVDGTNISEILVVNNDPSFTGMIQKGA